MPVDNIEPTTTLQLTPQQGQREALLRHLVGDTTATCYRDACLYLRGWQAMRLEANAFTHAMLLAQVEGRMRGILLPEDFVPLDNEQIVAEEIQAIGQAYSLAPEVLVDWRSIVADLATRQRAVRDHERKGAMEALHSRCEQLISALLDRLDASYLPVLRRIDALGAGQRPTLVDVRQVLDKLPDSQVARGFLLGRLPKSGLYLELLAQADFFRQPPQPVRNEDGSVRYFPSWPESQYLKEIVAEQSERVGQILLAVPLTDNEEVLSDLAETAMQIPPLPASLWAQRVAEWLHTRGQIMGSLAEHLGELGARLASVEGAGYADAALAILRALLGFRTSIEGEQPSQHRFGEDQFSRTEADAYRAILEKHVPLLRKRAPWPIFDMLCEIAASRCRQARHDVLSERRRAIEPHPDDTNALHHEASTQSLISGLRDAAESLAEHGEVQQVVARLEAYPEHIFHRIALHILRRFPDGATEMIQDRLTRRDLFEDVDLAHEFTGLLRESFARLSTPSQLRILGWIEGGPRVEQIQQMRNHLQQWANQDLESELKLYIRRWQYLQLNRLGEHLPPAQQARWRKLQGEFGTADAITNFGRRHGPRLLKGMPYQAPASPKTAEELAAMDITDLVAYLRDWQPSKKAAGDPDRAQRRDLAGQLRIAVAQEPGRFAERSGFFVSLRPVYLDALLQGLYEAIREDKKLKLPWGRVLATCKHIAEQRDPVEAEPPAWPYEPNWSTTHRALNELMKEALLYRETPAIPFEQRHDIFAVLEAMLKPAPVSVSVAQSDAALQAQELATGVQTSTRAVAMRLLIRYAHWAKATMGKQTTLVEQPEVRALLERHLDPSHDADPLVRAIYGETVPTLSWLDSDWFREHLQEIFPQDPEQRMLWDVAWRAYLDSGFPDRTGFSLLRGTYEHALALLEKSGPPAKIDRGTTEGLLAEHLGGLYLAGNLDFDPHDLFSRFIACASDELRARLVSMVRYSLERQSTAASADVANNRLLLERAQKLWSWRLPVMEGAPVLHAREILAFGDWFGCAAFDMDWALALLERTLLLLGIWERFDNKPIHRLAELAGARPVACVRCLELLVLAGVHVIKEPAWVVLQTALSSGDTEAVRLAHETISRLIVRGRYEFENLLISLAPPAIDVVASSGSLMLIGPARPTGQASSFSGISRFRVEGFKSLAKLDLELGLVNVFVGANGSGKSNLLEAIGVLGAAIDDKVEPNRLRERGVRRAPAELYKSSFRQRRMQRVIRLEARTAEALYLLDLDKPTDSPDQSWGIAAERLDVGNKTLLRRTTQACSFFDKKARRIVQPTPLSDQTMVRDVARLRPDAQPAHELLDLLKRYRIYSPTTPVLRGLDRDEEHTPLGLGGSRLPNALSELLGDARSGRLGDFDLEDIWEMIDWTDQIKVISAEQAVLSPSVNPGRFVVQFRDRFMAQKRNLLSGYDASEGALYVLFYLALACHPQAPAFCAIDNFDQALNPRLACRLTKIITKHLVAAGKQQWLLTTHNPLVLDGLDLADDRIRLFALNRDDQGMTKIERVIVDPEILSDESKNLSLSRLWVMGRLGGVPPWL